MSLILIFIITVLLLHFIKSKYKIYLTGWNIPGPWALPLLGNVQMVTKLKPQYLFLVITENRQQYRKTFRLWLGPELWVFLHSPAETRDALNDRTLVKPDTFKQLHFLIGNGLLVSEGKFWETHRRALGPAFHPNILNTFTPIIIQHADELVRKLHKIQGKTIEVDEYLFPCILDAIIETSMGKKLNSQNDLSCTYTHSFHKTSELLFKRMLNPLLASEFIFKLTPIWRDLKEPLGIVQTLVETVIRDRAEYIKMSQASVQLSSKSRLSLLDTLLMADIDGRKLSLQEIHDEVNTFVFAGVDTTTASMGFILYALAKYPAEQIKLYDEIQELLMNSDVEPSMSDFNRLEYLDMFIKECLRFYTIVPMTGRLTTTETKIGQKTYSAGVTLWINMYGLAHDDELFEDPYAFLPERFSKDKQSQMEAFSYLPYSGGPHVCIGRKYSLLIMKILTVRILQHFEVELANPNEELELMAQMVLKSVHGINLKFKPRI